MWGAKIKWPTDMSDDMLREAVEAAKTNIEAIEDWQKEGDTAALNIKKQFDDKYSAHWHCIVGKNFGSLVTHETFMFAFFYIGDRAVLLFKAG